MRHPGILSIALTALSACASSHRAPSSTTPSGDAIANASAVVDLDLRARPRGTFTLQVAEANDLSRGELFATMLEGLRPCVDDYRAPRGAAGGAFGVSFVIGAEGALTRTNALALGYSSSFERCVAHALTTMRWAPAPGFDVGFTARVVVTDTATVADRRRPRRPLPQHGHDTCPQEPAVRWYLSRPVRSAGERALFDEVVRRQCLISDCLWHTAADDEHDTDASLHLSVLASGELRAVMLREQALTALGECVARSLSLIAAPPNAGGTDLDVTLQVGPGRDQLVH